MCKKIIKIDPPEPDWDRKWDQMGPDGTRDQKNRPAALKSRASRAPGRISNIKGLVSCDFLGNSRVQKRRGCALLVMRGRHAPLLNS